MYLCVFIWPWNFKIKFFLKNFELGLILATQSLHTPCWNFKIKFFDWGLTPSPIRLCDALCYRLIEQNYMRTPINSLFSSGSETHGNKAKPQQAGIQSDAKSSTASQQTDMPLLRKASWTIQRRVLWTRVLNLRSVPVMPRPSLRTWWRWLISFCFKWSPLPSLDWSFVLQWKWMPMKINVYTPPILYVVKCIRAAHTFITD